MQAPTTNDTPACGSRSATAQLLVLGAAAVGGLAVMGPLGYWLRGVEGLKAAIAAAGVCLVAAVIGVALSHRFSDPRQMLVRMLAGLLPRMVLPLAACLVAVVWLEGLAKAGFVHYAVGFYMVMLATDVWLLLPETAARQAPRHEG